MLSHTLLVGFALAYLTALTAEAQSAALTVVKSHAYSSGSGSNSHAIIVRRQLPTTSILDDCPSCVSFGEAMAPCPDEKDHSCTCKDETLRYFIACEQCQPLASDDYPGGLPKLAKDVVSDCRSLGYTVSDIDTSALSSSVSSTSRASSATSLVSSVAVSSALGGGLLTAPTASGGSGPYVTLGTSEGGVIPASLATGSSRPPNCAAICNSVCELHSGRSKRQTTSDSMRDCMCTQAYFDSQYSCLACGTQLLGSDSLQRQGVDALKQLQETCQAAGFSGITTQDGLATFNPASTSFGGNSASSTRDTAATTGPANPSGGPVSGGDTNPGAGFQLKASPAGVLLVFGMVVMSGLVLCS